MGEFSSVSAPLTSQGRRFSLAGLNEVGSPALAEMPLSGRILLTAARSEAAGCYLRDALLTCTWWPKGSQGAW